MNGRLGNNGAILVLALLVGLPAARIDVESSVSAASGKAASAQPRGYSIPLIDLAGEKHRQVIVDKEPGQYLGHPSTVLLKDNRTILVAYPKGHGRGSLVMKKSTDGGLTWSERLPVPENWATSKEVPTLFRVTDDARGVERLVLFSGLYPIRMAVSEDNAETWSPLEPIGDFGGVVAMSGVVELGGHEMFVSHGRVYRSLKYHIALFHDDGRFLRGKGKRTKFQVFKTLSRDGGLTWSEPEVIAEHPTAHLCEPGAVHSPDKKQIAVLLRENSRKHNSFVIFSDDEGETWSNPRELPGALTGDRHVCRYAPDGRLVITFRDMTHVSPTRGDFVAWIGTYDDIVNGREGQYRVRLLDNKSGPGDTGYAGLELLPDGTFVATTYCVLERGEKPLVESVRFKLDEIDERAAKLAPEQTDVFISGRDGYHTYRIPSLIVSKKRTLLAFCEGRKTGRGDHGDLDLVLKRSTDNGKTWSPQQIVYEEGGAAKITIGNPCPVVDRDTGTIWLPFCRNNDRVFITKSIDDGLTWSKPVEITGDVKKPGWGWYATGPGVGIQLRRGTHKGRLVIPCDHREKVDGQWLMFSHVFYSDDHGQTWQLGGSLDRHTDECQVVELTDGRLLINMRNYWERTGKVAERGGMRAIAWSRDGGESWSDLQFDKTLIEPVCQASFIRYSDGGNENGPSQRDRTTPLLFSNPASRKTRHRLTIRMSTDEGKTWPIARLLHAGPSAYSCLTTLPDGAIGILYERGDKHAYETITFARCSLQWLAGVEQ